SVTTTIFAFLPMFFVSGVMGKFFAVLPMAVIAMLVISMFEATFILPCHLAHDHRHGQGRSLAERVRYWQARRGTAAVPRGLASLLLLSAYLLDPLLYPFRCLGAGLRWVNGHFGVLLDWVIFRLYTPLLRFCLRQPALPISMAVALLLASLALVRSGTVPWVVFPKLDARQIQATVIFPDGTPARITEVAIEKMEEALLAIDRRHRQQDGPVVRLTHCMVGQVASDSPGGVSDLTEGSHAGSVYVELVDNKLRSATSQELIDQWRREVGRLPGVESVSFRSVAMGPGGRAIEFKLLAPAGRMEAMERAVETCKRKLASYPGVLDIADDSRPGKWEFQLQLKENARDLGVPLEAVAQAVRAAYYGQEVMRLQRGRHEVKLMVRYPSAERRSIGEFNELRVDTGDGVKRPITELARVHVAQGYSEINRLDQMRSITISADVDESHANAAAIVADLKTRFMPQLLDAHPQLRVRWEGQHEQTVESVRSLFVGMVIAMLAMYVLLTFEFTSYTQPAIIMAVIPFGIMGAVWGHAAMGLPLTLFSVLGLVALTGIVVNDSIVLIDFVNSRLEKGVPLRLALLESGQRRFRPVLLTSLTTIAGMLPLLTETSMQAQILIPMANSLCFGLVFSTSLVLVLVPSFFVIYGQLTGRDTVDTIDNGPRVPAAARRMMDDDEADPIRQDEPAPTM
ncbi:MAG: efflux RND transporter permease subunit, partial [Pirellulales bacterium]